MAFLGKGRKADLLDLANELGVTASAEMVIAEIKTAITSSKDYDEDFVKVLFETILAEKKLEKAEKLRLEELDRIDKQKQKEFELTQQEIQAKFDLEKLRIEKGVNQASESTESTNPRTKKPLLNLKKLIPEFNPNQSDICLYLIIFERQAKRAQIEKKDWVGHLLSLLPLEIVQLIAREPEELAENYDHVKRLLLKRFKLSPEIFRQKFTQHEKKPENTWKDFTFEIRNYLEEWVTGLNVESFEELKDLMVADQLKKRARSDMREHFLDDWTTLKSSSKLAELFDNYENVRKLTPKRNDKEFKNGKPPSVSDSKGKDAKWGGGHPKIPPPRDKAFEKRAPPRCFHCNELGHIRPSCPKLNRAKESASVNSIEGSNQMDFLGPFTEKGFVNGQEIDILRDTGATIDLVPRKFISPHLFCSENIWIKQPLSPELICLPLAVVEISGSFGTVQTKAAVCGNHSNQEKYLLGNKTAVLIKEKNGYEFFPVGTINAVQTRSQAKRVQTEEREINNPNLEMGGRNSEGDEDEAIHISPTSEEQISVPAVQTDAPELELLKIDRENFIKAQKESSDLKTLFEHAMNQEPSSTPKTYSLTNGLLVKNREDKLGNNVELLVIPENLREQIKSLCHEGTSAHLGTTKTKDKLNRYFYWPNCYKEIDEFVKTCDQCQRAGKPNEKTKAPLKLVPVIQEVFTKLNIDACGPLPITENGNRYVITAMCMSSKYPEAVPVSDIGSVSVTDALLNIFSRMGFPREIQCDQGTSFTSALTTEFFERFGINVRHSSVHHPQSNPIERFHRTLKRLVRALCLESGTEWDRHLPSILLALRTVTHESTGYTPSELVYGKNLRTPETLIMEHWMEPGEEGSPVTEYVFKLINRLKRCQEVSITKMEEMQIKRKLWYDRNAVKREFREGDLVLVLATNKPNKLSVQWIGPGTIRSKISDTNYLVEIPGRKERSQIYHVNMLKPYYKRPEHVNLLACEEDQETVIEEDTEIPYLEKSSTIYDFPEIIESSKLNKTLKETQIDQLRELLSRNSKCFSNEPGLTDLVEHNIELTSNEPIRSKPYRVSQRQNEILKSEIQEMLKLGIIEVGESDYTSPMILVEVPGKEPRPCIDYRRLNEIIRTEYFPIPNIEERVEQVSSAKFISLFDLKRGYWQIKLSKEAQRYAAFCTTFGTYRPLRMSFGLKNAPYFFSKLMSEVLKGFENFAIPYLDDIAVFSDTWESHLRHLECVLDRIKKAKLTIKPSKCKFAQNHLKYLGHDIGNGSRTPAQAKVQSVVDFPTPRTKTQIRAFLGLAGYYGRYIENFSVVAAPLTDALKGKAKKGDIVWTSECEEAFQTLKHKLIEKPVLYAPNFKKQFIVQTDASNAGVGVVLTQLNEEGEEHPILYLSKKFSEVEKRYSTTEKECASIVFAVKKLHYYLDGSPFVVMTDHNPLVWLRSNASSNPRLMRWALVLQPYDFKIVHRSGKNNKNADSLSRSGFEE